MAVQSFEWYDTLIFSVTLAVALGIGLYYGCRRGGQTTIQEYLMGGRSLKAVPMAMSMIMSYTSAIFTLGNTAELYLWGNQNFLAVFGNMLSTTFVALLFVPLFFPLKLTSCFEYIQMRFHSHAVRLTGTMMLMVSQCLYMGIALYSPAISLDAVTQIPAWLTIILTGVVGTVYTTLGGMRAVVWTDVFQFAVMLSGLIAVLVVGIINVGSFDKVWTVAAEHERLRTFVFDPNPLRRMSFWSVMSGSFFGTSQILVSQVSIQRFSSLSSLKDARNCLLYTIPGNIILKMIVTLTGLVVFSYYFDLGCDPLRTDLINSPNQLLPFFIIDSLKSHAPGLPGLFVAVLFAGALSTLSSSLNSLAAVTWKDILEPRFNDIPEARKAVINKLLVGLYGAIVIAIAFTVQFLGGHVLQASQSLVGGVAGPLLGIFILGAFFPLANWIGALVGAWVGLLTSITVAFGAYVYDPYRQTLPTNIDNCTDYGPTWNVTKDIRIDPTGVPGIFRLSYHWAVVLGTLLCVIVGLLVSIATGPNNASEVDPRLIIPWMNRLCCYLPHGIRQFCYCGIDHDSLHLDENGFYQEEADVVHPQKYDDDAGLKNHGYSGESNQSGIQSSYL